jgi:hypothetical protein
MRVCILNGNPDPGPLDDYLSRLSMALVAQGHGVVLLALRELKLQHCTGCFGCWVKTPGQCTIADDGRITAAEVIGADLALLASPIRMGFVSALLSRANERLLPLILPYSALRAGESRHLQRYPQRPRLGLLLDQGPDADAEDVAIIEGAYRMTARNFDTALAFVGTTAQPLEEVAHALDRV